MIFDAIAVIIILTNIILVLYSTWFMPSTLRGSLCSTVLLLIKAVMQLHAMLVIGPVR